MKYLNFLFKTKNYINKNKITYLIDATNQILGRFCSNIIKILIGKINYNYTKNYSFINKVIIINSKFIKINKYKINNKKYYKYSGYIGNKKTYYMKTIYKKNSSFLIKKSIFRMLPKNSLGKKAKKNILIFNNNHNFKNLKYKIIKFK
ncbi:MAG: hypothetical protein RDO_0750 [Flavobacteriales endosymbiont of Rhyzopertha dominica]|nr:MAG: 50S ribosomal protein L13 [Candidatus Shikimatogenerans bostrichidophilus]